MQPRPSTSAALVLIGLHLTSGCASSPSSPPLSIHVHPIEGPCLRFSVVDPATGRLASGTFRAPADGLTPFRFLVVMGNPAREILWEISLLGAEPGRRRVRVTATNLVGPYDLAAVFNLEALEFEQAAQLGGAMPGLVGPPMPNAVREDIAHLERERAEGSLVPGGRTTVRVPTPGAPDRILDFGLEAFPFGRCTGTGGMLSSDGGL